MSEVTLYKRFKYYKGAWRYFYFRGQYMAKCTPQMIKEYNLNEKDKTKIICQNL